MGEAPIISVVDDDRAVLESLTSLLRSVGFGVRVFSSAEAFLEESDLQNVRCLILDLRMEGMDGLELQRHLACSGHRIPIIILSAHGNSVARSLALRSGAIEFLSKPFAAEALLSAVEAALAEPLRLS